MMQLRPRFHAEYLKAIYTALFTMLLRFLLYLSGPEETWAPFMITSQNEIRRIQRAVSCFFSLSYFRPKLCMSQEYNEGPYGVFNSMPHSRQCKLSCCRVGK